MENKLKSFLEIVSVLKNCFGIVPLLYGSLGLEYLVGVDLNSDDVDVLIPNLFLTNRWTEFKIALENNGYKLVDQSEHTFKRGEVVVSFAQIEELESFAGLSISEIKTTSYAEVSFKVLSAEQYLKVYTSSSKDGYRIHQRKKKDFHKILILKEYIKTLQS